MLASLSRRTYDRPMSIMWYFLVALFFLIVVILAVPGDGHMLPEAPQPASAVSLR